MRQALPKPVHYISNQSGAWDGGYVINVQPSRAGIPSDYAHRPDERTSLLRPAHRAVRARGVAYRTCLCGVQLILFLVFVVVVAVGFGFVTVWDGWMRRTRGGRKLK